MRADLARFVVANEDGVEILVVIREVSGSGLRCRCAVAGGVLAEIGDRQFRFARMVFQEIFQFGRAIHAGNLRQRNLSRIRRWRRGGLRGDLRHRGENEDNPKYRNPDSWPHLGYLYITSTVPSR